MALGELGVWGTWGSLGDGSFFSLWAKGHMLGYSGRESSPLFFSGICLSR